MNSNPFTEEQFNWIKGQLEQTRANLDKLIELLLKKTALLDEILGGKGE